MVFELIILRLIAALLVLLLLFWLGAIFWRSFNRNRKFDKFVKTMNEQPQYDEGKSSPAQAPTPAQQNGEPTPRRRKKRFDDLPD